MVEKWWFSSKAMTVQVNTVDGRIIWGAPIVRRFVGQPLECLKRWMSQHGGLRIEQITPAAHTRSEE